MKNKNIVHQKIDLSEVSFDDATQVHEAVKEMLPNDYILITTSTDIEKVDGDFNFIKIGSKSYSYSELIEIIESKNKTRE